MRFAETQTPPPPTDSYGGQPVTTAAADPSEGGGRKPFWRRRWFLIGAGLLLLIAIAGVLSEPEAEDSLTSGDTTVTTASAGDEDSSRADTEDEPSPTSTTEAPSSTTTTARPSSTTTTSAPPPETWQSFTISGSGDDVVDFAVPGDEPAIVTIEHSGSRNFAIVSYTSFGDRVDLLVNEIGSYRGRVGINFLQGQEVGELEITADGSWTLTAAPLLEAPSMVSSYEGVGDDVILFAGSSGRLQATHTGESNFAIIAWGDFGRDLVVNEIGNYSGTVRLDDGTILLAITADGAWSLATE